MPLRCLLLLVVALTGSLAAAAAATITAADPRVRVEGRSVPTARQGVKLGYPGVALHLTLRGTSLSCHTETTSEEVDFDVMLDGALHRRLRLPRGEAEIVLFEGQANAEHHIELVHCTETSNGVCEFITLTGTGEFMAAPGAARHQLLFIGDSFTAGAATECRPGLPINPSKARRQNARLSYGWLLSRRLQADVSIVAYAGRGLQRDWQGLSTVRCAPEFYEYTLADDDSTPWDHAAAVPDVITVCLGNDFDAGIPDEVAYVRGYAEFVRKLRRDAPHSLIVLLMSPVVRNQPDGAPRRDVLRANLDQVVRRVGDPRVIVADVGTFPGVPGDWHPDGTAHESVADQLEPLFRRALESAP
jgi:hypothetical protein